MLTVSLSQIYNNPTEKPCADGWHKICAHRGVKHVDAKSDDTQFPLREVFESNGLEDALWVMDHCINPYICRLFAADCAEQVLFIFERERPDDMRPRNAIEVARNPDATQDKLAAAGDAAWAAAGAAARAAAWAAARAAAWAAAGDAAGKRFLQYCDHGEAAKDMPWEVPMVQSNK